eukprot:6462800-Amphidinium_carterae.1
MGLQPTCVHICQKNTFTAQQTRSSVFFVPVFMQLSRICGSMNSSAKMTPPMGAENVVPTPTAHAASNKR